MKNSERPEQVEVPEKMIRKLSELLKSTDLAEIEFSIDSMSLRVKAREFAAPAYTASVPLASPTVSPKPQPDAQSDLHIIRSPFIGTFYRTPSPTSPAFVEEGQMITKGQVLCIVEAMKIMNEIEADISGKIEKIFVDTASPVDFNAPLFGIRKS